MMKIILLIIYLNLTLLNLVKAQLDSLRNENNILNIVSLYKPSLVDFDKVYFNPYKLDKLDKKISPLSFDNSFNGVELNIPYKNIKLHPLIYYKEPPYDYYKQNISIGYGQYYKHVPLISVNLENGNGKNFHIISDFEHFSIKGNINNQNQSLINFKNLLIFKNKNNNFWNFSFEYYRNNINLYGINKFIDISNESLNKFNLFQSYEFATSYEINKSKYLIIPSYNFKFNQQNNSINEINNNLGLKYRYVFLNEHIVNQYFYNELDANINLNLINSKTILNNILFNIENNFIYDKYFFKIGLGLKYIYSNLNNNINQLLFPNINFDINLLQKIVAINFGTTSTSYSNNLISLSSINSFITDTFQYKNTLQTKFYFNINGTLLDDFSYKLHLNIYKIVNALYFKNNSLDLKTYNTYYIPNLDKIELRADFKYEIKFIEFNSFFAKYFFIKYSFDSLWGLQDYESQVGIKFKITKKLKFNIDYRSISSTWYLEPDLLNGKPVSKRFGTNVYFNINLGIEYKPKNYIGLWLKANNILNLPNNRWGNYNELGFNILGGLNFYFTSKPIIKYKQK